MKIYLVTSVDICHGFEDFLFMVFFTKVINIKLQHTSAY